MIYNKVLKENYLQLFLRIADGNFTVKLLQLGDTVIFSSNPIP